MKHDREYFLKKIENDRIAATLDNDVHENRLTIEKIDGYKVSTVYDFFPYTDPDDLKIYCNIEYKSTIGYCHIYKMNIARIEFKKQKNTK